MWEAGHNVDDIAYALEVSHSTVRRCIDRDFRATPKKLEIADRHAAIFPYTPSGNYRAKVSMNEEGEQVAVSPLEPVVSGPESYAIAIQEVERLVDRNCIFDTLQVWHTDSIM